MLMILQDHVKRQRATVMACGGAVGGECMHTLHSKKPPALLQTPPPPFILPNCAASPLCCILVCTLLAVEPERMLLFQALPSSLY